MKTIAVAWLDCNTKEQVWCRARHKRYPSYQDNVKTRCGFTITMPVGLEPAEHAITCPMCLAREKP